MSEAKSVLSIVLLTLQFCLGFWQIVKLTLFGALVKGYLASLMSMLPWGLGSLLSPTYTRLKTFEGDCVSTTKSVELCHAIQAADEPTLSRQIAGDISGEIKSSYLGEIIDLERREGNKLFKDGKMAYYITDAIWASLLEMGRLASLETVFIKGHKKIGDSGVSGGVMDLCEVLDSLILENHVIKPLEYAKGLLPINMSVSEEKILKALNLAGLFLQTKKEVHWLIPILFSFTAAVLEFMTPLREWLYAKIKAMFNCSLHLLCDRLALDPRAWVFTLVRVLLVELDPFNDIEWKVVRGNICAVIGGGAKCDNENATLVQPDPHLLSQGEREYTVRIDFSVIDVTLTFNPTEGICEVNADIRSISSTRTAVVSCKSREEYKKLITFVFCMAKNGCTSMRCCSPIMRCCSPNNNKKRVRVRWWDESIDNYVKSGFPGVYEVQLENVVVK